MSTEPTRQVRKISRVALVLELSRSVDSPTTWWGLTVSGPYQESTSRHTWITNREGQLTGAKWLDMCNMIEKHMLDAMLPYGGVQGELEGLEDGARDADSGEPST